MSPPDAGNDDAAVRGDANDDLVFFIDRERDDFSVVDDATPVSSSEAIPANSRLRFRDDGGGAEAPLLDFEPDPRYEVLLALDPMALAVGVRSCRLGRT